MNDESGTKLELTMEGGGRVHLELPMYLTQQQKRGLVRLIVGLIDLALEPPPPPEAPNVAP